MPPKFSLTRRQALAGAATVPLVSGLAPFANAAAPMHGPQTPLFNRFTLGSFEVTTLLAASASRDNPQGIFGLNVSEEEFAKACTDNFIPADRVQFFFTPTLVNTGTELVLFDTGLNPTGVTAALTQAGYSADQIDSVVITHMHGDHIGGLMTEDTPTFANAKYVTGSVEYDHWSKAENKGFDTKMKPLAEKTSFLQGGGAVTSGVTAVEAFGHTPGHMAYMVESDGKQLLLAADFANHYVWSVAHPDWEVKFDMDKSGAAGTRRKLLDMLAADRVPFIGYHMPFPAMGYVAARGEGFQYVPASYQMML